MAARLGPAGSRARLGLRGARLALVVWLGSEQQARRRQLRIGPNFGPMGRLHVGARVIRRYLMRRCPTLSGPRTWSNQKATRKAAIQSAANTCPTRGSLAYEGDVAVLFMRIFSKNVPNLVKSITFAYELRF